MSGQAGYGIAWKTNKRRKKAKRSVTPGKQKGGTCQADAFKRFCAKRSRSYKHPDYAGFEQFCRVANKQA